MSRFTKQKVFCNVCGKDFETSFGLYGGVVCGSDCFNELEWIKTLSIMGREYRPQPEKKESKC